MMDVVFGSQMYLKIKINVCELDCKKIFFKSCSIFILFAKAVPQMMSAVSNVEYERVRVRSLSKLCGITSEVCRALGNEKEQVISAE